MGALLSLSTPASGSPTIGQATSADPQTSLSVPVFEGFLHPGGWATADRSTAEIALPAAAAMQQYDTLMVTLSLACPPGANCGPWDFFAYATACPKGAPTDQPCDKVFGQWVTPYGRPGTWTTDISGMLALLADGGAYEFSFWTPQSYVVSLRLDLSDAGSGLRPSRLVKLFRGDSMPLDANFNGRQTPVDVVLDASPTRADLYVLMLSQGQGGFQVPDCAEFCNLTHIFGVNGTSFSRDFTFDLTPTGCQDKVSQGVVADQAGTWATGRAGWCPGWHVLPWTMDVTQALTAGHNTLGYQVLYEGAPYNPKPVANPPPNSFAAQIQLSSYLVLWAAQPTSSTPSLDMPQPRSQIPAVSAPVAASIAAEPAIEGLTTRAGGWGGCRQISVPGSILCLVPGWLLICQARRRARP